MELGTIIINGKTYEAYTSAGYIMLLDCGTGEAMEHDNLNDLSRTIATLKSATKQKVQKAA